MTFGLRLGFCSGLYVAGFGLILGKTCVLVLSVLAGLWFLTISNFSQTYRPKCSPMIPYADTSVAAGLFEIR